MKRMIVKHFVVLAPTLLMALSAPAFAQFGGRHGDVVFLTVTANGSGDLQAVSPTTNTASNLTNFKITSLDSVPISSAAPFAIKRQVFYEQPNELFEMNTDDENSVGAHRIFLIPTKLFFAAGVINPLGNLNGNANTYISIPQSLDVTSDLSLETLQFLTWSPKNWPFIAMTTERGPVGPPDIPGWLYLFEIPNAVVLPSLVPWTALATLYPGSGWQPGFDSKLLEIDSNAGNTTRMLRLRPGVQTPPFRIPGHTHLYVLQGGATITPAGGGTLTMKQNDYAFLPEGFTVTLSNPQPFEGAGAQ